MLRKVMGMTVLMVALALPAQAEAQLLPKKLLPHDVMPIPYEVYDCDSGPTCTRTVEAAGVTAGCEASSWMGGWDETCGVQSDQVNADCTESHHGATRGTGDYFGCWVYVGDTVGGCSIYEWEGYSSPEPEGREIRCEPVPGG